jgi:hypothetical protein
MIEKTIAGSGNSALKSLHSALFIFPWVTIRQLMRKGGYCPKTIHVDNYGVAFEVSLATLGMSSPSRFLLDKLDIATCIERRRRNYLALLDGIRGLTSITPLFPRLPDGVCPWVFPIVNENGDNAHLLLRKHGIPAVTWEGVIHPTLRLQEFSNAAYLYKRLIMLPVHQSISAKDLGVMIKTLKRIFEFDRVSR